MDDSCLLCNASGVHPKCACGKVFCQDCLVAHRERAHGENSKAEWSLVTWIRGRHPALTTNWKAAFARDESTKWFGFYFELKGSTAWGEDSSPQDTHRRGRHVDKGTGMEEKSFRHIIETPRFSLLIDQSRNLRHDSPRRQFPRIVTFVGKTGSGKSTMIRALISLATACDLERAQAPTPANSDEPARPTTGEVNLYPDPGTFGTESPLLYADCEGFDGGQPLAADYQNRWPRSEGSRLYTFQGQHAHSVDRKHAVEDTYPRFLYIVSDVICMVVKNTKTLQNVVAQLLEWSQIGAGHTVNRYARPAAIIVINMDSSMLEWAKRQNKGLTEAFLMLGESEIFGDTRMKILAENCGAKTLQQLLDVHFSEFHIYSMPQTDDRGNRLTTASDVKSRVGEISRRLQQASWNVHRRREQNWIRLDSDQMSIVFGRAFQHLVTGRSGPFNFNQTQQQVPIPRTYRNHLVRFSAIAFSRGIPEGSSYCASLIAQSLVIETLRTHGYDIAPTPDAVFTKHIQKSCTDAAGALFYRYLRCAYRDPLTGAGCLNTRSGHGGGHQLDRGPSNKTLIRQGLFEFGDYTPEKFVGVIERRTREFASQCNQIASAGDRKKWAIERHKEAMQAAPWPDFWDIVSDRNGRDVGDLPCIPCLSRRTEYRMPCGHYLCHVCIDQLQDPGLSTEPSAVAKHRRCPICGANEPEDAWPVVIQQVPPLAGVRILSLDGGGVRGILEVLILRRLEKMIGLEIPIRHFFDLIVGTSAGGLIALGLGVHGWDIDTAVSKFDDLSQESFKKKPGVDSFLLGWYYRWGLESKYETDPLEKALRRAFSTTPTLFGLRPQKSECLSHLLRVAVTTNRNQVTHYIANYDAGDGKLRLESRRPTWEAARATSAAPYYFTPFRSAQDGDLLIDGGLHHNNPVDLARLQARNLWSDNVRVDTFLSVGSGQSDRNSAIPSISYVPEWAKNLAENYFSSMDGERKFWQFWNSCDERQRQTVRRLNIDLGHKRYELDDNSVETISELKEWAQNYSFTPDSRTLRFHEAVMGVQNKDSLLEVATRLKASLFYFRLGNIAYSTANRTAVSIGGSIGCRIRTTEDGDAQAAGLDGARSWSLLEEQTKMFIVRAGGDIVISVTPCWSRSTSGNPETGVVFECAEPKTKTISFEVQFKRNDETQQAPISGCPYVFEDLETFWKSNLASATPWKASVSNDDYDE